MFPERSRSGFKSICQHSLLVSHVTGAAKKSSLSGVTSVEAHNNLKNHVFRESPVNTGQVTLALAAYAFFLLVTESLYFFIYSAHTLLLRITNSKGWYWPWDWDTLHTVCTCGRAILIEKKGNLATQAFLCMYIYICVCVCVCVYVRQVIITT